VSVWDIANGAKGFDLPVRTRIIAVSPDGQRLATGSLNQDLVHVWDVPTGKEVPNLRIRLQQAASLAFSPDGRVLATCGFDGHVRVWDLTESAGAPERKPSLHWSAEGVATQHSVAFSPDSKWLAATGLDGSVAVWDASTGQEFHTFRGNRLYLWRISF